MQRATKQSRWRTAVRCLLATWLVGGCASLQSPDKPKQADEFEQRKRQVGESYERNRDDAQYRAAVARWREGDAAGSRTLLVQLLSRNARHFEGRLLQAELFLWDQQYDDAERLLRELAAEREDHARPQHLLGMTLDARGNPADAAPHLRRAVELDPGNERYAASLTAVEESTAAAVVPAAARR